MKTIGTITVDISDAMDSLIAQKHLIDSIAAPFLKPDISPKYATELYQVAKFLMILNDDAKIVSKQESPDFHISIQGQLIGLEHERIFIKSKVDSVKSIENLLDAAAKIFCTDHPNVFLYVTFWLYPEYLKYSKSGFLELAKKVSDFVYSYHTEEETKVELPFFRGIDIANHETGVVFRYNPGITPISELDEGILIQAIKKKEKLITKYRENLILQEQWLLLVCSTYTSDSYQININVLPKMIVTCFDRIYLMDDFLMRCVRLK